MTASVRAFSRSLRFPVPCRERTQSGEDACGKDSRSRISGGETDQVTSSSAPSKAASRSRRFRRHATCSPWTPYHKPGVEELLQVTEEARAPPLETGEVVASQQQQPLAPCNTTQFLMDEHRAEYEDELRFDSAPEDAELSVESGGKCVQSSSPPSEGNDFISEDFADLYESFNAERLSNMSDMELVLECTELDHQVDVLDERVKEMCRGEIPMSPERAQKIMVIQKEISKVLEENERLRAELDSICRSRQEASKTSGVATGVKSGNSPSCSETTRCEPGIETL